MLRGVPPLIGPELLGSLPRMGYGDVRSREEPSPSLRPGEHEPYGCFGLTQGVLKGQDQAVGAIGAGPGDACSGCASDRVTVSWRGRIDTIAYSSGCGGSGEPAAG